MKRAVETFLVVAAAPLWLPVLGLAAAAVAISMGRPVFFRQARAGRAEKAFDILKLRTMRPGSGSDRERLTKLGRFLRATSLDELPQLLHVLTGTMALVGPRPLPVAYLPRYTPQERRRHEVRPGLTGWAQVQGRNALTWEQKFACDVWYVENRSLALDAKILMLTLLKVLHREGIDASALETMRELRPEKDAARGH